MLDPESDSGRRIPFLLPLRCQRCYSATCEHVLRVDRNINGDKLIYAYIVITGRSAVRSKEPHVSKSDRSKSGSAAGMP